MVGLKAIARILGGAVKLAAAGPLRRRHDCHHVGRSRRHIHLGQGAAPPSRRTEQVPYEPPPEPVTTATNAPEFQRGDTVTFDDSDGRAITGVIVRINQRTAMTGTGTADRGTCRVPFHMLRHVLDIRESRLPASAGVRRAWRPRLAAHRRKPPSRSYTRRRWTIIVLAPSSSSAAPGGQLG